MADKRGALPVVQTHAVRSKMDVVTIVRAIKSQMRNALHCRESLLHLHARLFEGAADRKESIGRFLHASTGGIQVVLAAIEHHISDVALIESAVVLLYTISHSSSRRNVRILQRLVKKGGSKVLLSIMNYHKLCPSIFVPAAACLVSVAGLDQKLQAQARLSGCLTTLVAIVRAPPGRDVTVSALSCLYALSRSEQNLQILSKKNCCQLVLDLMTSKVARPFDGTSALIKFSAKLLTMLAKTESNLMPIIQGGGVRIFLGILQELGVCVDSMKTVLELLELVTVVAEGKVDFERAGGRPYLIQIVKQRAAAAKPHMEDQILEVVNQLYRFHNIVDLPLGNDAAVCFDLPPAPPSEDGADDASPPNLDALSPELMASIPSAPRVVAVGVCHVRPFVPPRPAPSCPSSINYAPPPEPLYVPPPSLKGDLIAQLLQRLMNRPNIVEEVVFDDVPRGAEPRREGPKVPSLWPIVPLTFTSQFESGNLRRAIRVGLSEYDLILNCDINTSGYVQWFYFAVESMVPGIQYKLNIINMEKPRSTFSEGQKVLMFSEREFTSNGVGWTRAGSHIAYIPNSYRRKGRVIGAGKDSDSDEGPSRSAHRDKNGEGLSSFFSLTFTLSFMHRNDRVYLANCYPYTYSDLQHYLGGLRDTHPHLDDHCIMHPMCQAIDRNVVNMLTITTLRRDDGERCSGEEIANRRVCFITSRVHPGESNASYMMKGLIDILLDGANPESAYLRNTFVWKIVPMITVDGVINGNHRCSLIGRDLNREYLLPGAHAHPVIHTIKAYVKHMKEVERRNVFFYCDLHGHSRKPNFFCFGCGGGKKTAGLVLEQVFPKLLSEMCPFFRFDECRFRVMKGKEPTGRVVMWKELGIRHSYTLEGSMMGGGPRDTHENKFESCPMAHYSTVDYAHMGHKLALAIGVFLKAETDPSGPLNEIITSLLESAGPSPSGPNLRHRASSMGNPPLNCLTAEDGSTVNVVAGRLRRSSVQSTHQALPQARGGNTVLRASSAEVDAARHVLFHWVAPLVRGPATAKGLEEDSGGFGGYEEDEEDDADRDSDLCPADDDADD